jgi:multidrug resistance efflux pump
MTDPNQVDGQPTTTEDLPPDTKPVRRWTMIVLLLCVVLLAWHLMADRFTPHTTQARLHALVVPVAPQVSGNVARVAVSNNEPVEGGQVLFEIESEQYELALQSAQPRRRHM